MNHFHHGTTDFGRYTHPQLCHMLYAGEPGAVRAAADAWAAVGRSLHDRAGDLDHQLQDFESMWAGGAADQYKSMVTDLANGIRQVATTALTMRDLTSSAAESLTAARARMPAPVAVPDLSPVMRAMAETPPNVDGMSPTEAADTLALYVAARNATLQVDQASAASAAAQSQAVLVMAQLAGDYIADEAAVPEPPSTASMPTVNPDGSVNAPPPAVSTLAGSPPVLFGGVFTAGLAAAGAALGGRFAGLFNTLNAARDATVAPAGVVPGEAVPGTAAAGPAGEDAAGKKLGLAGGGGIGKLGGLGGGGLGSSAAHAAIPIASGALAGAGAASALGGATGAAGAATAKAGMSGMMPMMPMGMGVGEGGMSGGRRIPPWLVETEDVWGESSVVAPTVIGEEDDLPPARGWA